jgi:hypothetical protein
VNAGGIERFVRVDVTDSGKKGLTEQNCFDPAAPLPESANEFSDGHGQGIRADRGQGCVSFREKLKAPKGTNIVEEQDAIGQLEASPCVLTGLAIPKQLSRHP